MCETEHQTTRYRFTTGYVAELLLNGLNRPHRLLNAYVEHFTAFRITDAVSFVSSEGDEVLPVLTQYKVDFFKLKKSEYCSPSLHQCLFLFFCFLFFLDSDMLATIYQLTTHYLMRSVLPVSLGKDEATYVEYGFARFVDSETKTVAVDEPLVLLAATQWINNHHGTRYKLFAKQIHLHDPNSNGFENYIAFCIDMMFSSCRRLSDVFAFVGTPPDWSALDAELVALYTTPLDVVEESSVRHYLFSGPSVTLGTNAKSLEETSSWLEHQTRSAICFPQVSMGPDLIFILRLSDGSLIWVVLQAKYSVGKNGSLSRKFLRQAMRSVTPASFFLGKACYPVLFFSDLH